MGTRHYPLDSEKIRQIYEMDQSPEAHQKLHEYIETEIFPLREGMSAEELGERESQIRRALHAAKQRAHDNGWTLDEYRQKAKFRRQTVSGYEEGKPI